MITIYLFHFLIFFKRIHSLFLPYSLPFSSRKSSVFSSKVLKNWSNCNHGGNMNKILFLGILILLGVVFLYLMFNPPKRKKYNLKSLTLKNNNLYTEALGKELFVAKSSRKFILPTEFDLWSEIALFENCIVFKRNNKEKKVYFSEIYEIEPMLINSFFVKGKYFGYVFKCKDNSKIIVKSNDIEDLELFMEKLFNLFPKEMVREI